MINNLHNRLYKSHTPFAYAAICALVIGLGDLIATGTDIYWLIGDMRIQTHTHHYFTMFGLVTAIVVMLVSFVYLYIAINGFLTKKAKKERDMLQLYKTRYVISHDHCDISKQKVVTNNYLMYTLDMSEE